MCPHALEPGQKNALWIEKLDTIIGAATRSFIKANGLKRGMKVLDLGCGPGVMVPWLAEMVGPDGHVYATDPLSEEVEATIRRVRKKNISNVTCMQSLPATLQLPVNSLDLIFCRNTFVYMRKPKQVLNHLNSLLKPGGILIVDEPITGTTQLYPAAPCIQLFNEKIIKLGEAQGSHFRIAPLLAGLFRRVGLAVTRHQIHTQRLPFEDIAHSLYPNFVEQVRNALIKYKVMSSEEIDAFLIELKNLNPAVHTHGTLATHVRIVALKPNA